MRGGLSKLDEFTKRRAIKRYIESEETMKEIASNFGITERTLARYVKAAGVPRKRNTIIPEGATAAMVEMYQSGLTCSQIGARYGCCEKSAWRRLKKAGIKLRKGRAAHPARGGRRGRVVIHG